MLPGRGAPRFSSQNYIAPLLAKVQSQLFELCAFAASIEAFEGDEQPAIGMGTHEKNNSRARSVARVGALHTLPDILNGFNTRKR